MISTFFVRSLILDFPSGVWSLWPAAVFAWPDHPQQGSLAEHQRSRLVIARL
jgi:hypothetical protein